MTASFVRIFGACPDGKVPKSYVSIEKASELTGASVKILSSHCARRKIASCRDTTGHLHIHKETLLKVAAAEPHFKLHCASW